MHHYIKYNIIKSMKKQKILISLSAGIDSTTTLLILKKNGFYIEALFMTNWTSNTTCLNNKDITHAKILCKKLKIILHFINLSHQYWSLVFITFLKKLKLGLTPNPDIICNEKIKFNILLKHSKNNLNFNFLSTGHYAKLYKKNSILLQQPFNLEKDQTYFLSKIKSSILKYVLFPIANYSKHFIKKKLKYLNFLNSNKKNSTGICFIGADNFKNFIKNYLIKKIGEIKDSNNKQIGYHDGLHFYTIGQKKTYNNNTESGYIFKKNIQKNILYITTNSNSSLTTKKIKIHQIKITEKEKEKILCTVKIRNQNKNLQCLLNIKTKSIILKKKDTLAAPGQYISFYKNNIYIGCATIK